MLRFARQADLIIAAWGNHGGFQSADAKTTGRLGELHCLGVTKLGRPRHPLYVRSDTRLVRFVPRVGAATGR